MKYSFKNDYSEGAHENILNALVASNMKQEEGYGGDSVSLEAKKLMCTAMENKNCDIHFVSGGTQANLIVISSILKPYESVIAAETAHIVDHETGAIEAVGHKINTIKTENGKLTPEQIQPVLDAHNMVIMVKPKLVFISNTTEIGSIYSKQELKNLSDFCKKNNLFLYCDGARLGSALSAKNNNLTLADMTKFCDIFYIGGTKNGALLGEAIVIINEKLKENFAFNIRQKGALFSKGRTLAIQFLELFKNNLFLDLAKHSNLMAEKIAEAIKNKGYSFITEPESNQIFPILPNTLIEKLEEKYFFYRWEKHDETSTSVRFVTSWATDKKYVNNLIEDINNFYE